MKARALLDVIRGYNEQPIGPRTPTQDRAPKMGTVDPTYSGSGSARVQFDGETSVSVKAYALVNCRVQPGDRVVLLPVGKTLAIFGAIGIARPGVVGQSIDGYWTSAPSGTLLEDGSVQLRASYPALFAQIGVTFNTGGETGVQFRLPDSRGYVHAGKAASGTFATLGAKVGAETHTNPLSANGQALIEASTPGGTNGVYVDQIATASWTATQRFTATGGSAASASPSLGAGAALSGATDAGSSIQPTLVCLRVIVF